MSKSYQSEDPLHGHGKAMPHPKQPTRHTYRGGRFGRPVFIDRDIYTNARTENRAYATANNGHGLMAAVVLIAACLGFHRKH